MIKFLLPFVTTFGDLQLAGLCFFVIDTKFTLSNNADCNRHTTMNRAVQEKTNEGSVPD